MATAINELFTLFLVIAVPVMSYITTHSDDLLLLPRKSLYFSAVVSQWLLAVLTALVLALAPTTLWGFSPISWGTSLRWTVGLIGASSAGIGLGLLFEAVGWWPGESPLVMRMIPVTRGEKLWALLIVAPTAGLCEEFIYRGYLLPQLARQTHSLVLAWVISSLAFGFCHTYQKFGGVLRASLLGALLAAPVVFIGSLYPGMATHFLIDAAGLLWIGPASVEKAAETAG